jgi:hypothetical protein
LRKSRYREGEGCRPAPAGRRNAKPNASTNANGKQMPPSRAAQRPSPRAPPCETGAPVARRLPTASEMPLLAGGGPNVYRKPRTALPAGLRAAPADVEAQAPPEDADRAGERVPHIAEINDHLPDDILDAEQIEVV